MNLHCGCVHDNCCKLTTTAHGLDCRECYIGVGFQSSPAKLSPSFGRKSAWSTWRVSLIRRAVPWRQTGGSPWLTSAGPPWTGGPPCPCCRGWWQRSAGRARKATAAPWRRREKFSWSSTAPSSDVSPRTATTLQFSYLSTKRSLSLASSTTAMTSPILPICCGASLTTPSPRCPVMSLRRATPTR